MSSPSVTIGWLHVVALLGAIQGVFLAAVLATKRTNRTANRLLAAAIVAFSVQLASAVYYAAGLETVFPHFFGAAHPMPFLYGPLLYLYAVTAADRRRRFSRRDLWHFVPFVAVVVTGLPIYLSSGAEKIALYHRILAGDPPRVVAIATPLKLVSGVIYATMTLRFLRRHRNRVKESYSTVERVNLQWLLWFSGAGAFVWLLAVSFHVLETTGILVVHPADDVITVAIAIMVYCIGYMGLRQPEIFRYETAEHRVPVELREPKPELKPELKTEPKPEPKTVEPAPIAAPNETTDSSSPRYERSGLSSREAERLKAALMAAMDKQQPWRQSELTLSDLADVLSTTPHKLSEVINAQLGQTFYDFVNGYRVREVQRRIVGGDAQRLTILSLALDAGFASKSTFNVVFKKHTNQTPSDFRQTTGV